MFKSTSLLVLVVIALSACSDESPVTPRNSSVSDSDTLASRDEHGYGLRTVMRTEYRGVARELTNGELVDLIVLEHYLADRNLSKFELEISAFSMLAHVQSSDMAFLIAPPYGVTVQPEEFTARVRLHLGMESKGEQSPGDQEFDEKFNDFLETVGITEGLYLDYVRKSLFLEAFQIMVESQGGGIDFQRFLDNVRDQFDLKVDVNSGIDSWIQEQVEMRVA